MRTHWLFLLLLMYISCIEPYDISVLDTVEALVVDASITNEQKAHYVKLTKSIGLNDVDQVVVSNATIWVEDNNGLKTTFNEVEPGVYLTDSLFAGTIGNSYTLYIDTPDGNHYKSTKELLLPPTPIDSVYGEFKVFPSSETGTTIRGVQFFLSSSGNMSQNNTSYYRYEFDQDYAIQMPYRSPFIWLVGQNTYQFRDPLIDLCYQHIAPSGLLITTTAGQSENKVSELPLTIVEEREPYLFTKYSLVVRQFSISPGAFNYFKTLKNNNEASGTFFDKQKGAVWGNLININDSSIPVLGYFEVAGVSINKSVFTPSKWKKEGYRPNDGFEGCRFDVVVDTVLVSDLNEGLIDQEKWLIFGFNIDMSRAYVAPQKCSDCRLKGTLKKPEFWD